MGGRSCLGSVKWLNVGVAPADEYTGIGCGNIAMAQGLEDRSGTVSTMARNLLGSVVGGRARRERRKYGRLREGETLGCNLGSVVDLSDGGTRILGKRKRKGKLEVMLWDTQRGLSLPAEVIWCKRLGFRKYEVGLEFRHLTMDDVGALTGFATRNHSHLTSSRKAA
ncbi:MAG: PilZ domain-containing protein [Planctomycetota bacterium]|nr:PilZ domain-containing protein [Planctomycetota bacterium]